MQRVERRGRRRRRAGRRRRRRGRRDQDDPDAHTAEQQQHPGAAATGAPAAPLSRLSRHSRQGRGYRPGWCTFAAAAPKPSRLGRPQMNPNTAEPTVVESVGELGLPAPPAARITAPPRAPCPARAARRRSPARAVCAPTASGRGRCGTPGGRCGARACWCGRRASRPCSLFGFGPHRTAFDPPGPEPGPGRARRRAGGAGGAVGLQLVPADRPLRLPPGAGRLHRLPERLLPPVSPRPGPDLGARRAARGGRGDAVACVRWRGPCTGCTA